MTRANLVKALEQQGFRGLEAEPAFAELWAALACEALDAKAFHAVLRHLKLHLLCGALPQPRAGAPPVVDAPWLTPPLPRETGFISVVNWCPRSVEEYYFRRPPRPLDVFLTHRDPRMKMRWMHCQAVGRATILRLAVKYQLHPLPVEDTIQLQQQSVPLVRKYNDNFFVVIPLLRLTAESRAMLGRYRDWKHTMNGGESSTLAATSAAAAMGPGFGEAPCVPQVEQCRLALFAAGPPLYDTVISVQTEWRTSRLHVDHTEGQALGAEQDAASPSGDGSPSPAAGMALAGPGPGPPVPSSSDAFSGVVREILRDFSMLRAGNASWLLWRLLDVCVDELTPILSAYRAQLRWFSGHITQQDARVSEDVEKRLLRSKVELDWLQRKVRPMIRVLKHLIRDKAIDPDVTRYLEDVEDHLGTFIEEVGRIIGVCNSLRDEVHALRDRQQQKVLYVLTLVTTLVMPTHLLTGVFGMNFQDEAGQPVVPGLGQLAEQRGYYLFWGTSISLTTVIYLAFSKVLKWI